VHTPYDGSSKLFQIGLKPLDLREWIDADDLLTAHLDEKARLWVAHPDEVFVAEAGSEDAQTEVLELLAEHLPERFPDLYRQHGETIDVAGRSVALASDEPPLRTAARLVQEDLVIMRKGEAGWRLAAGSLSFPSSWRLREKFGLPMHEVHAPVPGFNAGTRNADLIARMFDHLRPAVPVLRWNWSLYNDGALFHPESGEGHRKFGAGERAETVFLRVERQTLRKLPRTGDILFTIRIYVDPIETLERQPEAAAIAAALAGQLMELSPEQLAYKGIAAERDRLVARLRAIETA
jgi:dimethylamine monooxygenase subunit A